MKKSVDKGFSFFVDTKLAVESLINWPTNYIWKVAMVKIGWQVDCKNPYVIAFRVCQGIHGSYMSVANVLEFF